MTTSSVAATYPKQKRQEVFEALVELQDAGMPLDQSRAVICRRFHLTKDDLMNIEREGITENWPPLECEP